MCGKTRHEHTLRQPRLQKEEKVYELLSKTPSKGGRRSHDEKGLG